jgi:glucoamylase
MDNNGNAVGTGYDPNSDVVLACLHGAIPCTEPRLLSHAARLRSQWCDPAASTHYKINISDADHGMGPLLGRYPGDLYDGDNGPGHPGDQGHPWPVTSAALAQLYYCLAASFANDNPVGVGPLTETFFAQIDINATTSTREAETRLRAAADRILTALVAHSTHLSLSEQFDKDTGFQKSVNDLTWSYAAFLSAVRARETSPTAADS